MSLTLDDIKRVANLACIETSETEAATALIHLSDIFNLIEQMQAVDTSSVNPMSHSQDLVQRLRDDMVTESDQRELFQSIAPKTDSGLYLVPKGLE